VIWAPPSGWVRALSVTFPAIAPVCAPATDGTAATATTTSHDQLNRVIPGLEEVESELG
jgi:hypothetical protein